MTLVPPGDRSEGGVRKKSHRPTGDQTPCRILTCGQVPEISGEVSGERGDGLMDGLLDMLKSEHEQVKKVMQETDRTTSRGHKNRENLFGKFRELIIPHMKGEEKVFYPALMERKGTRENALEAIEEHHFANLGMKELDLLPKDNEKWHPKFKVLRENILRHIEEEESAVFNDAKREFSPEQMKHLHQSYMKEEDRARNSFMRRIERKIRQAV